MFFFITGGNSETWLGKQKINQSLEDYKIYKKVTLYIESNRIFNSRMHHSTDKHHFNYTAFVWKF